MKWMIPAALAACVGVIAGCDPNKKTSPAPAAMTPASSRAALSAPIAPPAQSTAPAAQYTPPAVPQPVVYDAPRPAQPKVLTAAPDLAEPASDMSLADASDIAAEPVLSHPKTIHHTSKSSRHGKRYVIKKGDSLWSIAQAHYGNGNRWKLIARANPRINPNHILAGTTIILP